MTVAVLGGAGYIGSFTAQALHQSGQPVVVIDDFSLGHQTAIGSLNFERLDVRDTEKLSQAFSKHQVSQVIHFAAHTEVGESIKRPLDYFDNNVGGMISVLKAMRQSKVEELVFSSTCAVYGIPETCPITEDMPRQPISPYGASKRACEDLILAQTQSGAIRSVILRYFNAAGAKTDGSMGEDHRPESHIIPRLLKACTEKRAEFTLFGTNYPTEDGSCVRDYIHVEDLAQAHLKALDYVRRSSDVFNLGTGEGHSNLEVIEMCQRISGQNIQVNHGNPRPGDPGVLVADYQKAQKVLKWTPQQNLEAIVTSAWAWHSEHPQGYSS